MSLWPRLAVVAMLTAAFTSGCVSSRIVLTKASQGVRLLTTEPPADMHCKWIREATAEFACTYGEEAVLNCLKNHAAESGGNVVVRVAALKGNIYQCENL